MGQLVVLELEPVLRELPVAGADKAGQMS